MGDVTSDETTRILDDADVFGDAMVTDCRGPVERSSSVEAGAKPNEMMWAPFSSWSAVALAQFFFTSKTSGEAFDRLLKIVLDPAFSGSDVLNDYSSATVLRDLLRRSAHASNTHFEKTSVHIDDEEYIVYHRHGPSVVRSLYKQVLRQVERQGALPEDDTTDDDKYGSCKPGIAIWSDSCNVSTTNVKVHPVVLDIQFGNQILQPNDTLGFLPIFRPEAHTNLCAEALREARMELMHASLKIICKELTGSGVSLFSPSDEKAQLCLWIADYEEIWRLNCVKSGTCIRCCPPDNQLRDFDCDVSTAAKLAIRNHYVSGDKIRAKELIDRHSVYGCQPFSLDVHQISALVEPLHDIDLGLIPHLVRASYTVFSECSEELTSLLREALTSSGGCLKTHGEYCG